MAFHIPYHDLVSLVGHETALTLSIKMGGEDIYVPVHPKTTGRSALVKLVGEEVAEMLSARCGGDKINIPRGPGTRARIWAMREVGWTVGTIARENSCTERTVYNVLSGTRPPVLPVVSPPIRRAKRSSPQSADKCTPGKVAVADE